MDDTDRKDIDIKIKIEIVGEDEEPPKTLGKKVSDFCMDAAIITFIVAIVAALLKFTDLSIYLVIIFGVFLGVSLLIHDRLDDLRYK